MPRLCPRSAETASWNRPRVSCSVTLDRSPDASPARLRYTGRVLTSPYVLRCRAQLAHFFSVVVWRLGEDLLHLQAMGLTYAMLLALIPSLAVTFAVLTGVRRPESD